MGVAGAVFVLLEFQRLLSGAEVVLVFTEASFGHLSITEVAYLVQRWCLYFRSISLTSVYFLKLVLWCRSGACISEASFQGICGADPIW
jgi:hypothetical protein